MSTPVPLAIVVGALDRAGIPHMVAGSLASSFHATPRTTVDIDLVVAPTEASLARVLADLDRDRFYVSDAAARLALANRDQFNVIDTASGWKVDLMVCKDRPFSREELRRRQPVTILGVEVCVATAEDTLLSKLEWSARRGSERQLGDAAGIVAARGDDLDDAYLDRWAPELGVVELLTRARDLARP